MFKIEYLPIGLLFLALLAAGAARSTAAWADDTVNKPGGSGKPCCVDTTNPPSPRPEPPRR